MLDAGQVPFGLVEKLTEFVQRCGGDRVIVRSSGVGEDGDQASFAGQLRSQVCEKRPTEIMATILTCWKSSQSQQVSSYSDGRKCSLRGMGVIVQDFVSAEFSGVVFTHSPASHVELMVEYVSGGCDQLVSGDVNPNRISVRRSDGHIVGHASQTFPKLPMHVLMDLLKLARRIESIFAKPMDIEWVYAASGGVQIVQARPITTLTDTSVAKNLSQRRMIWSNGNIAENYPEAACPLLYSIARAAYQSYFANLGRAFGLPEKRIEKQQSVLSHLVGSNHGHLYYNLTNVIACFEQAPFSRHLINLWCKFLSIQPDELRSDCKPYAPLTFRAAVADGVLALRMLAFGGLNMLSLPWRMRRFERRVQAFFELAGKADSTAALSEALAQFWFIRTKVWLDAALGDAATMFGTGLLRFVLSWRLGKEKGETFAQSALEGIRRLQSKQPMLHLWRLEETIRTSPLAMRLFGSADGKMILSKLRSSSDLGKISQQFDEYCKHWGFRFGGELLLTRPSYEEVPEALAEVIAMRLKGASENPDLHEKKQIARRQEK
jgi:hypothetical protein